MNQPVTVRCEIRPVPRSECSPEQLRRYDAMWAALIQWAEKEAPPLDQGGRERET